MLKFLLPIVVVLFFTQCEKDNTDFRADSPLPLPTDTLLVNDTFLTYWYFPVGSWWVYKRTDTTADIYDTATVINNLEEIVFHQFFPYAWERYGLNIEHTYFRSRFDGSKANQFISNTSGLIDRISSNASSHGFNYTWFFSWPIDSVSIYEKSVGGGGNSYLLDTTSINLSFGEVQNVVYIEYKSLNISEHIWLAKGVGKVKFKYAYDNSEWELINYHINN